MIISECLNFMWSIKLSRSRLEPAWKIQLPCNGMEESLLHSCLPLTHVPCLQVWSQSKPRIYFEMLVILLIHWDLCDLETLVVSTLDVMAHCSWISKSCWFLGLCYFDWFLLYWFTYSWGNSWLVFARRFPRSANPDHFWRGIQGIHRSTDPIWQSMSIC